MQISLNLQPALSPLIEYSRAISETGDPFSFSIAIINNWPPSKIGIGKRFNSPRLMLQCYHG